MLILGGVVGLLTVLIVLALGAGFWLAVAAYSLSGITTMVAAGFILTRAGQKMATMAD